MVLDQEVEWVDSGGSRFGPLINDTSFNVYCSYVTARRRSSRTAEYSGHVHHSTALAQITSTLTFCWALLVATASSGGKDLLPLGCSPDLVIESGKSFRAAKPLLHAFLSAAKLGELYSIQVTRSLVWTLSIHS